MAYTLLYGDGILYDPYTDSTVTEAKLTAKSNNPDYLDFEMPVTHALYDKVRERGELVTLMWNETVLFVGEVEGIDTDFYGTKSVSCVGGLSWLKDTVVRPYSTVATEEGLDAPATVDGLFAWYIDQHNSHARDTRRAFAVGKNQGAALDKNNYIYRSSSQKPTTWDEIEDKILNTLGGYVTVDYDPLTINLWADIHEQNAQVIDLGVNLTDLDFASDTADLYTAVRPEGGKPDGADAAVDVSGLADGAVKDFDGIYKSGDVVYRPAAVEKYGYRETAWTDSDCLTASGLLEAAARHLNAVVQPSTTVTVKAVDLALVNKKYEHLKVGHAVRVRSAFHGIDEYLVVTSAEIDLQDPGNTEYVLGTGVNTATGIQSAYVSQLTGNINHALDKTDALDKSQKETAKTAEDAAKKAEEAWKAADSAESKALSATEDAKNATDAVKTSIQSVAVEYATGPSATDEPSEGWSSDKPEHVQGEYTWMRTTTVKKDGTTTTSAAAVITGDKGETGAQGEAGKTGTAGASVKAVKVYYYLSDSDATQAGGEWQESVPAWASGKYIWQRADSVILEADGYEHTVEGEPALYGAFNSLAEGVENNYSLIQQNADAIDQCVTKTDADGTYQTKSAATQTADAFTWQLAEVRAVATGEGDELIANNIDGTGTGGWCSYTGTAARTDGRSQWNTVDGYQVVQLYGTADSTSKYRGQYYASDNCPLTAAASGTAAYPRAVDMSCEMRVATATADSGGYFRMTLQYKDASGNSGWLAGPTVPITAVMAWTKCSARAVLPANCAINGVWCFVHVSTAGVTVNCLLRQAHAKISPVGTGGANLMAGTAGFSALTGSSWANGGLGVQGSATLSHAHDSTCPVPESDCVTIAATTTGTKAGFAQSTYADLNDGDALTFSFWARASRDGCAVQAHSARINGIGTVGNWTGAVGTAWTRIITHGTVSGTVDRTNNNIGQVTLASPTAGDKLYVCGLKVERGGVASAWSTAPTDLTNYMRFTSEGLEVGKKVNGSYAGSHTVTTSDGFYIHDASHNDLAHYTSTEASLAGGKAVFKENEVKLANGKVYLSAGTTGGGAGAILRAANSSYPAVAIRSSANNSDNEINVWGTTGATMRGGGTQLSVANNSTGGTVSTVEGKKLSTNADWFQLGVNGNAGYKTYYLHTSDFYREISMASGLIIVVRGGLVCINVNTSIALASSWAAQQLGTIPSDLGGRLRPKYDVYAPAVCTSQTGAGATFLHVNTSGGIYLERQGGTALTTTAKYVANLVYPTQLDKTV